MEKLIINGGKELNGATSLKSGKNTVLPIIAACIMSKQQIVLKNCPKISDISVMLDIINSIGGKAYFEGDNIVINCHDANPQNVEASLTKCIRSSVFILGPILARFQRASISYPGGCEIGSRPIDLHISGLKALNVDIIEQNNIIECDGKNIRGGEVRLSFPSVGATENIMMAAVLTKGTTVIHNAAKEPEIIDLADFINAMGGRVSGAGSEIITIEGVSQLTGGEYLPKTDRIVAGTILAAGAMCGGTIKVEGICASLLQSTLDVFEAAGCIIETGNNYITMKSSGRLNGIELIKTKPFPFFPTDMQAQTMAMLTLASGTSKIEENLFENRFRHAAELVKMGADITLDGKTAIIKGVNLLEGCEVSAFDLRGGAALVIAGLAAKGVTRVTNIHHIDRGYESIENIFSQLGGDIERISTTM